MVVAQQKPPLAMTPFRISPALQSTVVLALNACLLALGIVLLILPTTIRHNLSAYKYRQFPIYPEGRPTSGSTNASYFPTHLSTYDNAAQIVLGVAATLYGGCSTVLLYFQCVRPSRTGVAAPKSPLDKVIGWVAMTVAGAAITTTAAVAAGLSFSGNEGSGIDLRSVGYWPWRNMFPTIRWSIEGWTCKVYEELTLPKGTTASVDFAQMCEYAKISKWMTLVLLLLGLGALALGTSALLEQQRIDRREVSEGRADGLRDSEKGDKEP